LKICVVLELTQWVAFIRLENAGVVCAKFVKQILEKNIVVSLRAGTFFVQQPEQHEQVDHDDEHRYICPRIV